MIYVTHPPHTTHPPELSQAGSLKQTHLVLHITSCSYYFYGGYLNGLYVDMEIIDNNTLSCEHLNFLGVERFDGIINDSLN